MKLLLDENLPKKLKLILKSHEVYTVNEKGWASKKNGELIQLMVAEKFEGLLTFDKNLQYQQNFSKYPLIVLILSAPDNTFDTLKGLELRINEELKKEDNNRVTIISI